MMTPIEPLDLSVAIAPGEPLFLLRGTDPVAHLVVAMWGALHERLGDLPPGGVTGALYQAADMERWARSQGRMVDAGLLHLADVLREAKVRLPMPSAATH